MFGGMTAVLETRADDPLSVVPLARQVVQSLDPALPITSVQTMERRRSATPWDSHG